MAPKSSASYLSSPQPLEYKVYKRRFWGLAQLVLLNIVVSWDVWDSHLSLLHAHTYCSNVTLLDLSQKPLLISHDNKSSGWPSRPFPPRLQTTSMCRRVLSIGWVQDIFSPFASQARKYYLYPLLSSCSGFQVHTLYLTHNLPTCTYIHVHCKLYKRAWLTSPMRRIQQ